MDKVKPNRYIRPWKKDNQTQATLLTLGLFIGRKEKGGMELSENAPNVLCRTRSLCSLDYQAGSANSRT